MVKNMKNHKTRKFGERAYILELGDFSIGKFMLYDGHYSLPLKGHVISHEKVFTLNKAMKLLESEGFRVASAEEVAQARIEGEGQFAEGGLTKEALIYFSDGKLMMTKDSPIFGNIGIIHELTNEDFYRYGHVYDPSQNKKYLKNAVQLDPKELIPYEDSLRDEFMIPAEKLDTVGITSFLLGDVANEYGRFLKKRGIEGITLNDASVVLTKDRIGDPATVHQGEVGALRENKVIMGFSGTIYHDPRVLFIKPR